MDPITHAASGAVAMLALPRRPATRWAVPLAALVAAFPDIDLAFVRGPLQFLQLHRGFTHALFYLPLLALLLALAARPLWKRDTPGRWPLAAGLAVFRRAHPPAYLAGLHHHLRHMIFLPFSAERVRLNGGVHHRPAADAAPAGGGLARPAPRHGAPGAAGPVLAGTLSLLRHRAQQPPCRRLPRRTGRAGPGGRAARGAAGRLFSGLLAGAVRGAAVQRARGCAPTGSPRWAGAHERGFPRPALRPELAASLREQSTICRDFLDFSLLPLTLPVPPGLRPADAVSAPDEQAAAAAQPQALRGYLEITDERFGSSLRFVRWIMRHRAGEGGSPFRLFVELGYAPDAVPRLLRERLYLPDSGRDSGLAAAASAPAAAGAGLVAGPALRRTAMRLPSCCGACVPATDDGPEARPWSR